jgi:hypothetical protein
MCGQGNFTSAFARAIVAATPPDLLERLAKQSTNNELTEQLSRLEQELATLQTTVAQPMSDMGSNISVQQCQPHPYTAQICCQISELPPPPGTQRQKFNSHTVSHQSRHSPTAIERFNWIKFGWSNLRHPSLASATEPFRASVSSHLHGPHRFCNTEYVRYRLQVIRQDLKTHLRTRPPKRPGQEVCRPHPVFERTEDMLYGTSSDSHCNGLPVELALHGFEYMLVLPSHRGHALGQYTRRVISCSTVLNR